MISTVSRMAPNIFLSLIIHCYEMGFSLWKSTPNLYLPCRMDLDYWDKNKIKYKCLYEEIWIHQHLLLAYLGLGSWTSHFTALCALISYMLTCMVCNLTASHYCYLLATSCWNLYKLVCIIHLLNQSTLIIIWIFKLLYQLK